MNKTIEDAYHRESTSSLFETTRAPPGQTNASLSNKSLLLSYLKNMTIVKFVASVPDRLTCRICKDVLRDAVQSSCGCRFCNGCADSKFSENDRVKCPGNEADCQDLLRDEIRRDMSARREIDQLLVYCTYKEQGCDVTVQWKKLLDHEGNCDYRLVACKHQRHGCTEILVFRLIDDHNQKCKYRPTVCKYCSEEVPKIKLKEHEKLYCTKIPIPCPYGCQTEDKARDEMEVHKTECPNKPEDCPYKNLGCKFTGSKDDIIQHTKSSTNEHIQYTTVFAAKIDLDVLQIKRDIQGIITEREADSRDLNNLEHQCESLRKDEEDLTLQFKDLIMKIVAQAERIIILERKTENCALKSTVDEQRVEIQQVKERLERFMEKIVELEQGQNSIGHSSSNPVQDFHRTQKSLLDQLKQHDRQIGIQDIRLAELDLRYQILETVSYGGVMIWKICDYLQRKQDAMTGRTLSLYSQPFYTEQFGYKMCGRVYLYGDGFGKGTHLSFYFVVMRGEYDALIPWPFRKRVTLALLDQERGGRDIMESFEPDTTSNSFTRPTREMNVASGCPQFVSHTVLEMSRYVKDDTLFLKIEVSD